MWQALPAAVYGDSSKMLHFATGLDPLMSCKSIYVRDCHIQLTQMALDTIPLDTSSGGYT